MSSFLRLLIPALAFAGFSCASQEQKEPAMQLAAYSTAQQGDESVLETERAINRLATARCLAGVRCGDRYLSDDGRELSDYPPRGYEECLGFYRDDAAGLVQSCGSRGIDSEGVEQCAKRWSTLEDCSAAEGPLALLDGCDTASLCR